MRFLFPVSPGRSENEVAEAVGDPALFITLDLLYQMGAVANDEIYPAIDDCLSLDALVFRGPPIVLAPMRVGKR